MDFDDDKGDDQETKFNEGADKKAVGPWPLGATLLKKRGDNRWWKP